jgi:glutaminyl-peptide cyclotransferase
MKGPAAGGLLGVALSYFHPNSRKATFMNLAFTMRNRHLGLVCRLLLLTLGLSQIAAACARPQDQEQFDGDKAYVHVLRQCEFGPRPVGSEAGHVTAQYIVSELDRLAWTTESQEFVYAGIAGENIVASKGRGPVVILGAHYDTRALADRDPVDPTLPVLGANDGASGVAVLLELARVLNVENAGHEVWLVFFDAEDQGNIGGWPFSVGATHMAGQLPLQPEAVVVVDMIGDAEQQIFYEHNSDAQLMETLWTIAAELGYQDYFIPTYRYSIMDDHIPFRQQGLVAVDIIDFDYPYWHTTEDTADKVSPDSLQRVGRVLETWLEEYAQP